MIYALDLCGTFVFAISGGLRAAKHELDFLGILVLAVATGVGGGLIRDVLLGATPPAVFKDEWYLVACLAGGIFVFLSGPHLAKRWYRFMVADAIGLGVFAAIGAAKGAQYGLGPIGIVMMAGLTATGGGVVRDILVLEIPAVIHKDFYATAALAGGVCFLGLNMLGMSSSIQILSTILVTTGLRFIAMFTNLSLPKAQPLKDDP
jgi:uncharacterized membrane protein YeiH